MTDKKQIEKLCIGPDETLLNYDIKAVKVMYPKPRYILFDDVHKNQIAKQLFLDEKFPAIPILNHQRQIETILYWYDLFKGNPINKYPRATYSHPIVIMAGGKGVRLNPFTKILPKPLLPVQGVPILKKIMDKFYQEGFTKFIVILNYKKDLIKMYLKENKFPYEIACIEESAYQGTCGGLKKTIPFIDQSFIVTNCDVLLNNYTGDILDWHKNQNADITLVASTKEMIIPYGVLESKNGQFKGIREKPKFTMLINSGVYVFKPNVLDLIGEKEFLNMNTFLERCVKNKKNIAIFPLYEEWFDFGQWRTYKESLCQLKNVSKT